MNILLFLKKYQILKFIFSLKSFIFLISFILSVPVLSIPTGTKIIHYYYENRFWISDPYNRDQMPGIAASYPSIEAAEAANKGQSIITQNYRGDVHVAIYRRDGDRWYWYDTSGPGCSDNCGQIKYLFEKISD